MAGVIVETFGHVYRWGRETRAERRPVSGVVGILIGVVREHVLFYFSISGKDFIDG